jgi:rubrerythrin
VRNRRGDTLAVSVSRRGYALHHHRSTRAPDRDASAAVTRGGALRTAALAAGGALATVTAVGAADRLLAAPSPEQDVKVLNLLLLVERVEVAFYEAALERAGLAGELEEYARAVAAHEREHVAYLEDALGAMADPEPDYDPAAVTRDPDAFAKAAAKLEDIAVGAYNGQAPNVTPGAFLAAARIVSVEARHAAWIRSIRNGDPAPDAVDVPYDEPKVRRGLRSVGLAS